MERSKVYSSVMFYKSDFQKNNLYNEENEISADFEFFRAIEINKVKPLI